jgi:outer membrane protein TolC
VQLIRRPDVRVAQAQWAAASANTDVARADLFPRISLTGLLGFTSNRISNFGDADSRNNSAGAFLTWPLLDPVLAHRAAARAYGGVPGHAKRVDIGGRSTGD